MTRLAPQDLRVAMLRVLEALDGRFAHTPPVLETLRHARARGNPGAERHEDWMPAVAGMTFYWGSAVPGASSA